MPDRRYPLAILAFSFAACADRPEQPEAPSVFSHARLIDAFPARQLGDRWERVCDGGRSDGLVANVGLVGYQRGSRYDLVPDGTFPGSASAASLTPAAFGFELDCVEPIDDAENTDGCLGDAPLVRIDSVDYRGSVGHDVIVLVDQAATLADSDPTDLRLAAARQLGRAIDPRDRFAIMGFGAELEGGRGLVVPCAAALGRAVEAGLDACFGVDRDVWDGPLGVERLVADTAGTSNLWQAIGIAYDYLAARAGSGTSEIVVLGDGDACSSCDASAEVLARIAADLERGAAPARIHFVQWQASDEAGRDPTRVEVACLTGGHYAYINNFEFDPDDYLFEVALTAVLDDVRLAIAGTWQFALTVPDLASDTSDAGLFALSGSLLVRSASGLVASDEAFAFASGSDALEVGSAIHDALSVWDHRPTIGR